MSNTKTATDTFIVEVNAQALAVGAGNTFAVARQGGPGISGYGSGLATYFGASFLLSRGGANFFTIANIGFETDDITSPPGEATLTLRNGTSPTRTNYPSDSQFILAAVKGSTVAQGSVSLANAPIRAQAASLGQPLSTPLPGSSEIALLNSFYAGGDGNSNTGVDMSQSPQFEGFVSGSSFASGGRFYSDPIDIQDVVDAGSGALFTINLNQNALDDMATADDFYITLVEYSSYVQYTDLASTAPSPGAASTVVVSFSDRADAASPLLTYKDGATKDKVPDKDRIEKDFTLNTYADITDQRTRFSKNGVIVDQVPFLLGTKGPLSLRGRQFASDGKPISSTVKPPNTSKD